MRPTIKRDKKDKKDKDYCMNAAIIDREWDEYNKRKISEKLVERLRLEFPEFNERVPSTEKPRRLYHGRNQRGIGAWSWAIGGNMNCIYSYGSQWSMREILNAKDISLFKEHGGDISILPEK